MSLNRCVLDGMHGGVRGQLPNEWVVSYSMRIEHFSRKYY